MKMFSDCRGECCVCACGRGCLAGQGDDDFALASKELIIDNLKTNRYPDTVYMKQVLLEQYGYTYEDDT